MCIQIRPSSHLERSSRTLSDLCSRLSQSVSRRRSRYKRTHFHRREQDHLHRSFCPSPVFLCWGNNIARPLLCQDHTRHLHHKRPLRRDWQVCLYMCVLLYRSCWHHNPGDCYSIPLEAYIHLSPDRTRSNWDSSQQTYIKRLVHEEVCLQLRIR